MDARVDLTEAGDLFAGDDGALFAREAEAAASAGDRRRADGLSCARALLAERTGDPNAALARWRAAFDSDPTLLVAFWGLRRQLHRRAAWGELQGVLERRIAAVVAADLGARGQETRAELQLELGRLFEDRLRRDDEAAASYRAGLREVEDHAGLLTALLLLGFRAGDTVMTAEALAGFLRRDLAPGLRASLSAFLARLERVTPAPTPGAVEGAATGGTPPGDAGALRALGTLRNALRVVGPEEAAPLVNELALLARAASDPATRAAILDELVSHLRLPAAEGGGGAGPELPAQLAAKSTPNGALAAAFLRERARLLRDALAQPAAAVATLRAALAHAPGHPLIVAELSDLIEARAGDDSAAALEELRGLLEVVAPGDLPYSSEAARELAARCLTALAAEGRWREGLALLDAHPELERERPDLFALEILLRAGAGDRIGLAAAFERAADKLAEGAGADPEAAAHALVVAGTLRERQGSAGAGSPGAGDTETPVPEGQRGEPAPLRLYRRAVALAPGYPPARQAVERRLWAAARWGDLAELLRQRLAQLKAGQGGLGADAGERFAVLEELVAVYRDQLDDPATAREYQEELIALTDGDAGGDARSAVRRHHLELAAAVHGEPSSSERRVAALCGLADRAERATPVASAEVASALRVEAARVAAAGGDQVAAAELLQQALTADVVGTATAGLERLREQGGAPVGAAAARAALVRDELARLLAATSAPAPEKAERVRALRFRVAWHALAAGRADEALEALRPLLSSADPLARAWSWEIARRSGDAHAPLAVLQSVPEAALSGLMETPFDLGEALERAGDLPAAVTSLREAQHRAPSTDAALGLLRVGAALGDGGVVMEAARGLALQADPSTARLLAQEVALLALLHGESPPGSSAGFESPGGVVNDDDVNDPMGVVLRWAAGTRGADALGAAAGLLTLARALPVSGAGAEAGSDRNGLLARAAARSRLGGATLSGAVHEQVLDLSSGAAPVGVGLADLPVAGRAERIAARVARAARSSGMLAYALDLERALDAEARGDAAAALDGFAQALTRDPEGIEALDGIKRLALATGDRRGAARAGMRLGAVLRVPRRAAAEFGMAAQLWEDLGLTAEASVAYWQALARDPRSEWLYERLRQVLITQHDSLGLDRLYGQRLAALDPPARVGLLLERAQHRLDHLADRAAAIEDFKRILKIDPSHPHALRRLATLALHMEYYGQAVRFLERMLARETDELAAAALRLELAEAHEAAREPARAIETLRSAASARPRDVAPWQRLTDLLLRTGDWSGALATLRSWDTVLADPGSRATIWLRIGCLLRDHGRDRVGAAAAFVTASQLDPLGDGIRELVALHGESARARREALREAIDALREALSTDPLDVPRLRRLKELYEWSAAAPRGQSGDAFEHQPVIDAGGGTLVAAQLLTLAGEEVELFPARRRDPRAVWSMAFWRRLRAPGGGGFLAEVWPLLAPALAELAPAAKLKLSARERERVPRGGEPRLAWVEAAAAAADLPGLEVWMARKGAGAGAGDPGDETVAPLDGSQPALLVGRGVMTGNTAARFRVGQALALIRERTMPLERISPAELATWVAAAAVVAGAAPAPAGGAARGLEERARVLARAMSRKERKALELQAPRFRIEPLDAATFRQAVLATADRLGLLLAGDVAVAVRVVGDFAMDLDVPLSSAELAAHERARELIQFALSDDHLALRRESGMGEG